MSEHYRYGTITAAGAARTGLRTGQRVKFTTENGTSIARTVYDIDGNRLCGLVDFGGKDRGIEPDENSVIATATAFGIEAQIVEQIQGPRAGDTWVVFSGLRTLTDAQRKHLEGADEALKSGGIEAALAFLAACK